MLNTGYTVLYLYIGRRAWKPKKKKGGVRADGPLASTPRNETRCYTQADRPEEPRQMEKGVQTAGSLASTSRNEKYQEDAATTAT